VNSAGAGDDLFGVMSYTRKDVDWSSLQPNSTTWTDSFLEQYGQDALACQQQDNVTTLPILGTCQLRHVSFIVVGWHNAHANMVRILRNNFQFLTKNRARFPFLSCSCIFLGMRAMDVRCTALKQKEKRWGITVQNGNFARNIF
jgi:hypothetical protein